MNFLLNTLTPIRFESREVLLLLVTADLAKDINALDFDPGWIIWYGDLHGWPTRSYITQKFDGRIIGKGRFRKRI